MEQAKKRGRPSKASTLEKRAEVLLGADAVPTIPKKRGRPAKAKRPGRPAKNADESSSPISDGDGAEDFNGSERDGSPPKLQKSVVAASKGRGRPPRKSGFDSNGGGESDADDASGNDTPVKPPSSAKRRKLGRPKKHQPSDDDAESEEEDRRPVGRPSTGAVSLNVVRTGRGIGRPKKNVAEKRATVAPLADGEVAAPKKRGRPPLAGKASAPKPTGRPRGRPKANSTSVLPDNDNVDVEDVDDKSNNEKADSDEPVPTPSPKKRGRPPIDKSSDKSINVNDRSVQSDEDNPDNDINQNDKLDTGGNGDKPKGGSLGNDDTGSVEEVSDEDA